MSELRVLDTLDLTAPGAVVGRHSVWLPALRIKVPFQFGGYVQKYRHSTETAYTLDSVAEEVAFLRALAERGWGVPIGRVVYFKTIISEHLGAWWADPCGAYGYECEDVQTLPPGTFTVSALRASGWVSGSEGAWSDLQVPERANVQRGRLVDVRRSWWDRLRWLGPVAPMPRYTEDRAALVRALRDGAAFPARARPEPYQEFWLDGAWHPAEREVVNRARLLNFTPEPGDSVVDVGCHTGGFLQFSWISEAVNPSVSSGRLVGFDVSAEYVALARRLARAAGMNICYRVADAERDWDALLSWLRALCPDGIDHLVCLSMTKHFRDGEAAMWRIADSARARRTYLETNAVTPGQWPWAEAVVRRGGVAVGSSADRNIRRLYRIPVIE